MRDFEPSDIVSATAETDAPVSVHDLRNWVRDGRFNVPLAEPRAGQPRAFPILAVYEAALLKTFATAGVPLEKAARWNAEIIAAIVKRGVPTLKPDGSQGGGGIELVGFHPTFARPVIHDGLFGETAVKAFYEIRNRAGSGGRFPHMISLIHLPALISTINRGLGVP